MDSPGSSGLSAVPRPHGTPAWAARSIGVRGDIPGVVKGVALRTVDNGPHAWLCGDEETLGRGEGDCRLGPQEIPAGHMRGFIRPSLVKVLVLHQMVVSSALHLQTKSTIRAAAMQDWDACCPVWLSGRPIRLLQNKSSSRIEPPPTLSSHLETIRQPDPTVLRHGSACLGLT